MRVAALYDVHGNLPALEAVLADVRRAGVDRIVVGGDVLPGPMPHESIACLTGLDIPTEFIHGNGDRETLAEIGGAESSFPPAIRDVLRWTGEQLTSDDRRLVAAWAPTWRVTIPELGDLLFCHATPRNDSEIVTRLMPAEALARVFGGAADVVICGHTHMQFDLRVGSTRVLNAGSVGMPFQEAGAYWLLLGPEPELRRTTYDLAAAAEAVRRTNYPGADEFARTYVLQPPAEADMLERMTLAGLAQWEGAASGA
jgi:predicted phosphodiesterase